MPETSYEAIVEALKAELGSKAEPVHARDVIAALESAGHDSAHISFVIADMVNHGELALDAGQRLNLIATPAA
jgi:ABC-type phosphate/phosphonate transport system substrate-binding protein